MILILLISSSGGGKGYFYPYFFYWRTPVDTNKVNFTLIDYSPNRRATGKTRDGEKSWVLVDLRELISPAENALENNASIILKLFSPNEWNWSTQITLWTLSSMQACLSCWRSLGGGGGWDLPFFETGLPKNGYTMMFCLMATITWQ